MSISVPACTANDVTPIVQVTDVHSTTEQRFLDGSAFSGTSIASEGAHRFRVSAVDAAGNSAEQEVGFTIDHTLPAITVSGVSDGEVASDTVTPIVTIVDTNLVASSLTLDGQTWTSGTPVVPEGSHVLVASASDCAGNRREVTVHFEIRRVAGELAQSLAIGPLGHPRVMVGRDCVKGAGPNCTIGNPSLLRSTLTNAQFAFEEAVGRDAWRRALRSGRFNVYVLYWPQQSEAKLFAELNEAVWLCEGLLITKPTQDALPNLREALGLDVGGNVSGAFTVTLGSVLGTGTLSGSDAAWLQLAAAQGIATAQVGPNLRVLAGKHAVGSGKSLTLGWDGENTGSSALYRAALDAVTPSGNCALLPAGAADVRVQVANTGVRSTSYTVDHTLASGLTTSEPLQHTLVISAAQSGEFNLPLRLPNATGSFQVSATLQAEGQQLDSDVLVINVEQSAVTLSSSLLSALQALTLDAADSNRRSSAIGMIQSAASRSNAEDAIGDVLSAIDKVRPITSANVTAVRIDLARLLRIYQLRWVP